MIRNAVLHLLNEQPLVADLYRLPEAGDAGLVCTNLRMMNGSRPVFIDDIRSTFFVPYDQIRFVEIPAAALPSADAGRAGDRPGSGLALPAGDGPRGASGPEPGVGTADAEAVPTVEGEPLSAPGEHPPAAQAGTEAEADTDLELDEEFLRRIRDI